MTEGDETLAGLVDECLYLPVVPEPLAPMLYTVPSQLFAYHLAMTKFAMAERAA